MRKAWLVLLLATPRMAFADDKAFEPKHVATDGKVSLQLEDAEISELVRVIGELTNKRFVIASPKLGKLKATVYAPQKVTPAEAYQAFLAVLASNGLTVVPQSGFYKIVESQDIARQLTPIERGDLPKEERYVTRIQRLSHLSAEQVATDVLSKLATKEASIIPYPAGNLLIITETAANQRRMLEVLAAIDEAGEEDRIWLQPLKYVTSKDAQKELEELLDLKKKTDVGAGPLHVGRLVAIERPNALAIVATRASYERMLPILDRLDIAPSSESQTHVVMLQHSEAKKLVGPINEALGNAVAGKAPNAPVVPGESGAPKVAADETTNALLVTAPARDFAQIKSVIDALDKPKRQVYIEAAVLDISAEHGLDLGVSWHGGQQDDAALGHGTQTSFTGFRADHSTLSNPAAAASDLTAFVLGVRGPDIPSPIGNSSIPSFGALLTALATSKSADIISTPHIVASDNTTAELKVQLQTSLQPNAPTTSLIPGSPLTGLTGGANLNGSIGQNYKGIGPAIKITPHLNESNEVRLDVDELISDVQNAPGPNDTFGTISYLERSAKTTLTVKDGETVVIGGLMRSRMAKQQSKVPVLGDIPVLGALFRTTTERVEKSNLVLILTPYVIRDEKDRRRIVERKRQEQQELKDHEAIFGSHEWKPPRDWARTRGLLADVRIAQRELAQRDKEDAARPPADAPAVPQPPLDLPVPRATTTSTPAASPPTPAVPRVVPER